MTTVITICDTCKHPDWELRAMTETDGEVFAKLIETAAAQSIEVETRRHSCLMGCTRACNVAIQATGKLAYTLGEFEVSQEAADAVVEYATLHAQSALGQVPYRTWPLAIKGHFVTRHPPLPE
ncbi:MAG: putative metal-binding protein [Paracoccaceae bacterium]|jgi:predicted metal-binding protein